ncbi:hypothetical protein APHAL10511_004612 [Amanita phalloides]|nr:hypothetical protein APHAL10511_004612 [Amanita phalloides]
MMFRKVGHLKIRPLSPQWQTILAGNIKSALNINCEVSERGQELLRSIRLHASELLRGLQNDDLIKAQLGSGHSYSRAKLKFNVNRVDKYDHSNHCSPEPARQGRELVLNADARIVWVPLSIAARIDRFCGRPACSQSTIKYLTPHLCRQLHTPKFGEALRSQVEERLLFFDKGELLTKNAKATKRVLEELAWEPAQEDDRDVDMDADASEPPWSLDEDEELKVKKVKLSKEKKALKKESETGAGEG